MRAGLRLALGLVAAALAFAPASALAQDTGQDSGQATTNAPATKAPATDAIGPRELQNFSIDGTVTRPADPQPAARTPARATASPTRQANRAAPAPISRQATDTAVQAAPPLAATTARGGPASLRADPPNRAGGFGNGRFAQASG